MKAGYVFFLGILSILLALAAPGAIFSTLLGSCMSILATLCFLAGIVLLLNPAMFDRYQQNYLRRAQEELKKLSKE